MKLSTKKAKGSWQLATQDRKEMGALENSHEGSRSEEEEREMNQNQRQGLQGPDGEMKPGMGKVQMNHDVAY